jgi:hypothetical protein
VETAPQDLLIWFAPRPDAVLQIEKLNRDRSGLPGYEKSHINYPLRAWYPRTGDWQPGQPQAFTTVLLPHAPVADPGKLAATICALQDTPGATVLQVKDGNITRLLLFNSSGTSVSAGPLITDAEAAVLTLVDGKPSHLSAWGATGVSLDGKKLYGATKPGVAEKRL